MDKIILSLLLIKSMTIYEMRGFISQYLSSACSDSLGSLQAAIKKLMAANQITYHEFVDKGLNKKEYRITDRGLEAFKKWIETPMDFQKAKNMEESKFFFMGVTQTETRKKLIRSYIDSLKQEQEKLLHIQSIVEATKENVIERNVERILKDEELQKHILQVSMDDKLEDTVLNIYRYQIFCLEYGLEKIQFDIDFFEKILIKEEDN
ncbi:MAG TPA: PadR family transcriptional regulator [Patescibacteria group bacterium]|nr:PadR family transcriptional regulator [Patescibacteria group bacterium]